VAYGLCVSCVLLWSNPGVGKAVAAAVAATTVASTAAPEEAAAFGPIKMTLTDPEYASVVCPPKTQARGRNTTRAVFAVCVDHGRIDRAARESTFLSCLLFALLSVLPSRFNCCLRPKPTTPPSEWSLVSVRTRELARSRAHSGVVAPTRPPPTAEAQREPAALYL